MVAGSTVGTSALEFATEQQKLPDNPKAVFALAGKAYEADNYDAAVQLYESIVRRGIRSGVVYYNLGNAYFRAGNLGRAILNYRRAQLLMPRDIELQENIDYARTLAIDEAKKTIVPTYHGRFIENAKRFSPNEITICASSLFVFSIILFCIAIFTDAPGLKKFLRRTGAIALLLSITAGATLGYIVYENKQAPHAIITAERVEVRAGPGNEFTTVFVLHAGAEVVVRRERNGWLKIEFPSVGHGWLPRNELDKIQLNSG